MNPLLTSQTLQFVSLSLATVELILALYIFVLNTEHRANRTSAALFLLFALNGLATGLLIGAQDAYAAYLPAALSAAATPVFGPALLAVTIILVKPEWLQARFRILWFVLLAFLLTPPLLVAIDLIAGTQLWYVPPDPATYTGGFLSQAEFTNPAIPFMRMFYLLGFPLLTLLPLGYLSFFDKELSPANRTLARLLLVGQMGAILVQVIIQPLLPQPLPSIITSSIFFIVYLYASFSQLISERRLQRGQLQIRITVIVLIIALPLLIFTVSYLGAQASTRIRQQAVDQMRTITYGTGSTVNTWIEMNTNALEQLVVQRSITSMDPAQHEAALQALDQTYDHVYLTSTVDMNGNNIARSDEAELKYYGDRYWYQNTMAGAPISFQTLIGRTSGKPAFVIAKPILSDHGDHLGVGMIASNLDRLTQEIYLQSEQIEATFEIFIIDPNDQLIAHTDPEFSGELLDFGRHPAVVTMRNSDLTSMRYQDQEGVVWVSYFTELEYGWGVVVEQREADLLASQQLLQTIAWTGIILGTLLLTALISLAIRQAVQPVISLTETATAIAGGDLTRVAPIQSDDEIGLLAQTFNRMTEQLLESISSLERRVSDRTRDLENRSSQLEAAAQVGRAASSILDVNELIQSSVDLIQDSFNLYYVGLFLADDQREYAVLRAGTGEAGQAMLARQHRLRIGEGMVGWAVANGIPRVAGEAGEDAVRLATSELPETRSEAAIPLRSRGQVIGAVTVQSSQIGAFDNTSIATLQTMTDLLSVAIDNARLYTDTQTALETTRRAYSDLAEEDWMRTLSDRPSLGFRSDASGMEIVSGAWDADMDQAWRDQNTVAVQVPENGSYPLFVPIRVRGTVIGLMSTQKPVEQGPWTDAEVIMMETIMEQIGVALDSARLYEETQIQANNERIIGEIGSRMRQTLDIESVLKTAARELRTALDLAEVEIRMGSSPEQD